MEHSIGPIWEANHVWLIFVFVVAWAAIPPVFAAVASTLYIPLTVAALGIIARGAAFAFRKASTQLWQQRLFGAAFAFSSFATPLFLGGGRICGGGPCATRHRGGRSDRQLGQRDLGGQRGVGRRHRRLPGRRVPHPGCRTRERPRAGGGLLRPRSPPDALSGSSPLSD